MTPGSRRGFLRKTAAATALAKGRRGAGASAMREPARAKRPARTTIARVDAVPIIYPTVGRFKFFEGTHGRRSGRASVVVKLTTEDGTIGWGQSVPIPKWSYETLESVYTTITRHLAPEIVGLDAADIAGLHALMDRVIAPSFSTGQPIAKAGIDLAAHDLAGKALHRGAADGWARRGSDGLERITLSWTLNPKTLDDVEPMIEQGKARGYKHFNVKVAPDPKYDIELCRIVKKAAPDGFLWADANGGYDPTTALEVVPKLADIGVAVLEQPVASNRLGGFKAIKALGALPILMDEGVVSSVELEEFHRLGLLDGLAMKPARCGGLFDAYRQCDYCRNHGLMLLGSGLTDPDVSLAASLALYGAFRMDGPAALNGPQFLEGSILKEPPAVSPQDGTMAVPRGTGLGVEVDETKLESLRVEGLV